MFCVAENDSSFLRLTYYTFDIMNININMVAQFHIDLDYIVF